MEEEVKERKARPDKAKYGKWRPGMVNDLGKGISKPGKKKGTFTIKNEEVELKLGLVATYTTIGCRKITHPDNIADGVQPGKLTIVEACREAKLSYALFLTRLQKVPSLRDKFEELKAIGRENMKALSEHNIEKALSGKMGITDKEKVEFSFRMLEKTDSNYNPKVLTENNTELNINTERSTEDLFDELKKLIGI